MSSKELTRMHYILLIILSFVPLIITAIAFPFLPDPLPAHFSFGGDVNRWGSVYESFLLPIIAVAVGLPLTWATKFSERKDNYAGRMVFYVTAISLMVFIVITVAMLGIWMTYTA